MKASCNLKGKSGIYAIVSENRVYIGSSKDLNERYKRHLSELKRNVHANSKLQKFVNKHGIGAIRFIVVEFCDISDLISLEQKWIDETKSAERATGFNMNPVADKPPMTETTRKKISKAQIGRTAPNKGVPMSDEQRALMTGRKMSDESRGKMREAKLKNPVKYWLGKKHSDETRAKISNAQIGKTVSDESRLKKSKKGIWISPNGQEITILNISQFCRDNNLDKARMCNVYNGERKSHRGYTLKERL